MNILIVDGNEKEPSDNYVLRGMDTQYDIYSKITGSPVNKEKGLYWEAMANIRWGVICLIQLNRFNQARNDASVVSSYVECAAIGRRLDEALYDFFQLIDNKD